MGLAKGQKLFESEWQGVQYNFVKSYSDVRKDTANWIALADYDMETARHMLAKDYLHQTMELIQWLKQHPNLSES
jgi:hypothetical protein